MFKVFGRLSRREVEAALGTNLWVIKVVREGDFSACYTLLVHDICGYYSTLSHQIPIMNPCHSKPRDHVCQKPFPR
jgi:hypothetical protein